MYNNNTDGSWILTPYVKLNQLIIIDITQNIYEVLFRWNEDLLQVLLYQELTGNPRGDKEQS